MPDLTIEHDPDSGCFSCPFRNRESCRLIPHVIVYRPSHIEPATDECPLRTARVVVQRPGGES